MPITPCGQLRPLLERYLARQGSPEEHRVVHEHIKSCDRCRTSVRAQEAVRRLLRSRAAEARAQGMSPTWRPRPGRLRGQRTAAMLGLILVPTTVVVLFVVIKGRSVSDAGSLSDIGVISDNWCGAGHHKDDPYTCVLDCIRKGAQYVFVSHGVTYVVRNQDFLGLAQVATRQVKLTGHVQKDGLVVSRLEPVN